MTRRTELIELLREMPPEQTVWKQLTRDWTASELATALENVNEDALFWLSEHTRTTEEFLEHVKAMK